jgi:hypothetical protein
MESGTREKVEKRGLVFKGIAEGVKRRVWQDSQGGWEVFLLVK